MRCSGSWTLSLGALLALGGAPSALVAQNSDLVPAGFGRLRQDQVAVRITTENLAVRALPLDERVIRLLAPDTYRSLRELVQSRAADVLAAARSTGHDSVVTFLVTFFAVGPGARLSPDQFYVSSQNSFYRPLGIVPLTPRWSEAQLGQRQQASAIYLFEPGIAVLRPFTVYYGDQTSDAWETSLRALDTERARVIARSAPQSPP